MAFCPNCGAEVQGRFCAKCGAAVPVAPAAGSAAAGAGVPPVTPMSGPVPGAQPYVAPAPTAAGMSDNVAGALCYVLGLITGIIFLALAPYNQSKFVRFHAFQAIFFHVAWIALWIVEMIIGIILPWALHLLLSLFMLVIALGGLAIWIFLIIKAYGGDRFKLPIVGVLAEKQA
jgi:uncharacterized membrane protein